jgi:hypothetical protein
LLISAVVLMLWGGTSPGLAVETATPDALCPDLPALRRAVEARLGVVSVEGDRGWTARTTMGHAPGQEARDFVRLELFDPSGDRKLERDLPLEGESCATMAQLVAMVLERYFRGVGWTAGALLPGSAPVETAVAPAVVSTAPSPPPRPLLPAPRPGAGLALRLAGGMGGGIAPADRAAAVSAGLRFGFARNVALGISVMLPPRTQATAPGDLPAAHAHAVPVRIGVDSAIGGALSAAIGPEVLLSIERAARDDGSARNTRLVVGAGVAATGALALGPRFAIEVRGGFDYALPLDMSRFEVAGRGEVLKPPPFQAAVTAGVRIGLYP